MPLKHFRYLLLCLFGLLLMVRATVARADDNPAYSVDNIKVDVTDKDAITAQTKAFTLAQEQAFQALTQRLLNTDGLKNFKAPDDQTLATMVRDYEITAEQRSTVRYIGTYSFRFKPDAVRAYISTQSLSIDENYTPPLLLLPFYRQGDFTIIWGDSNPWRAAWLKLAPAGKGNPTVPLGDAADVAAVDDGDALSITPDHLQILEQRYHANDAVIAIASVDKGKAAASDDATNDDNNDDSAVNDAPSKDPNALIATVLLYRTDRTPPLLARRITITGQPGDTPKTLLFRVAQQIKGVLQNNWKGKIPTPALLADAASSDNAAAVQADAMNENNTSSMPATPPVTQHPLLITAHFAGMQEWLAIQKALRKLPGAGPIDIQLLQPTMAQINFSYNGSGDNLRSALRDARLTLIPSDGSDATHIDLSHNVNADNATAYNLYRDDDVPAKTNSYGGNE